MSKTDSSATLEALSPFEVFPFATFVPGRGYGYGYRRHKTLGHAKASLTSSFRDGKLYRWVSDGEFTGKWEELND